MIDIRRNCFAGLVLLSLALTLTTCGSAGAQDQIVRIDQAEAAGAARLQRDEGFKLAGDGKFQEALAALQKAQTLDSSDATAAQGAALLKAYLADRDKFDQQRLKEYHQAIQRVLRSLQAVEAFDELAKKGLEEKLRTAVMEGIGNAQGSASTSLVLERAELEDVAKLKADTLKALDDSAKALDEAVAVLKDEQSAYAETFRKLADAYRQQLKDYRTAWEKVEAADRKQLDRSVEAVRQVEQDLAEALGDLESMISKDSWRVALGQARLAKSLAPASADAAEQDWYKKVVTMVLELGEKARKEARWYDALAAYAGLKELDEDNESFSQLERQARVHARIMRMYGRDENETVEKVEDRWKDYTDGIDAKMVQDAIDSASRVYVTSIDFRRLIEGALEDVQILAETPQVWETFKGLADEAKRKQFLGRIDRIRQQYRQRDGVSDYELRLALTHVLNASDSTVQIPTAVLAREFCDGFLGELDKFSSMIWPNEYDDFRKSTLGRFGGVGIQISKESGQPLRVVTPLHGSPAFEAGVKAGDLILKVGDTETRDYDIDKLVNMISGPVGTKIALTIKRPGVIKPIEIDVERAEIRIKTVKGWGRVNARGDWMFEIDPSDKVGYIRLTQFTSETHEEMVQALKKLHDSGVNSVVLDLRFNPGGLLNSAHDVSNEFLNGGMVVSTKGRYQKDERRADSRGEFLKGNLVVLVNEFSASAAEIVSGALKDWKRCTIVGERSYGKGSVQNVIPIRSQKAMLKLTTAYYYLPTGRLLHRRNGEKSWGVDPDVAVPMSPQQTRDWLEIRNKTDLIVDDTSSMAVQLKDQYNADMQLKTAVLLLKLKQLQDGSAAIRSARHDPGEDK